jgi:hypothetical protein
VSVEFESPRRSSSLRGVGTGELLVTPDEAGLTYRALAWRVSF